MKMMKTMKQNWHWLTVSVVGIGGAMMVAWRKMIK